MSFFPLFEAGKMYRSLKNSCLLFDSPETIAMCLKYMQIDTRAFWGQPGVRNPGRYTGIEGSALPFMSFLDEEINAEGYKEAKKWQATALASVGHDPRCTARVRSIPVKARILVLENPRTWSDVRDEMGPMWSPSLDRGERTPPSQANYSKEWVPGDRHYSAHNYWSGSEAIRRLGGTLAERLVKVLAPVQTEVPRSSISEKEKEEVACEMAVGYIFLSIMEQVRLLKGSFRIPPYMEEREQEDEDSMVRTRCSFLTYGNPNAWACILKHASFSSHEERTLYSPPSLSSDDTSPAQPPPPASLFKKKFRPLSKDNFYLWENESAVCVNDLPK